ncbi:sodium/potassium/calcium exchanger 3-like [Cetorhinus maximus]
MMLTAAWVLQDGCKVFSARTEGEAGPESWVSARTEGEAGPESWVSARTEGEAGPESWVSARTEGEAGPESWVSRRLMFQTDGDVSSGGRNCTPPATDDRSHYVERLMFSFQANEITGEEKRRAVLLNTCGMKTYGLIRGSTAPSAPDSKHFDDLVDSVKAVGELSDLGKAVVPMETLSVQMELSLQPVPAECEGEEGIHEFPDDTFTEEERQNGAFLLHVFCAMYMFYALALVCDDYFVPSLEKICEHLQLSEDVAGATFMAAGSSAPELFTSLIGVFIAKSDVGVGTIVGSAVFNILCIIGLCGIFTRHDVPLTWWSLFRDSVSYIVSILALILVIHDEKVFWWETLIMTLLYVLYIIVMKYNTRIRNYFVGLSCIHPERSGTEEPTAQQAAESNQKYPATVVILQTDHGAESNSVVMVDELFLTSPHKLSFPEASLRIMITRHFGPRTRLSMASRMLINERQRLIRSQAVKPEPQVSLSIPEKRAVENGAGAGADVEPSRGDEAPDGNGNAGEAEESNRKGEQENVGPLIPFKVPDERCDVVKWLISWPLSFLLYCTVPNCSRARWEKYFMATFICSTLWIALFSYIMVWMVTIIGYSLGIPDVIMGITFLAAGTSVPDCMASLIVARQGMGDMAVSNSIGSNVFDILLGLGVPWMLRTLFLNYGSVVSINSKGIVYSVILLLASVSFMVIGIHLNKWKLDRRLGLGALLLYAVFLCLSILIELNVFLEVNLPTCQ